jgi:hypothetical protein
MCFDRDYIFHKSNRLLIERLFSTKKMSVKWVGDVRLYSKLRPYPRMIDRWPHTG